MKVFIKKAAQYGAKVVSDKGKHLKFRDSLGHQISAPKTTSDFRAIRNFESELRGRGFVRQETTKKVKDALVKGSKETALPASNTRRTANQQTTFKQFTQKFQPNVQGPRKPNTPVTPKQGRVQGPESELAHRHTKAFDNRLDELIKSVRGRTVAKSKRKKITRAQLDSMNIPQKEKDKLIRQGLVTEGAAMALRAVRSNLLPKIMTGIGAAGTVFQASKADKERRKQLAKDNNLDITKPGDRAKLGRLLKKDTEAKKRAEKGDTRSQEQYRQEKAENRKTIDATRQSMGQSKAKPGTKKRAEIDKKLKDFRDELRDVTNDPIVPSRAKVRVKVGQEVPKPDNTLPKRTGASPQKVRDRRSYEAQQRRNKKQDIPEENKHRDAKLNYQYKQVTNPKPVIKPLDVVKQKKGLV